MYIVVTEQELEEFSYGQRRRTEKGSKSLQRGSSLSSFLVSVPIQLSRVKRHWEPGELCINERY